MTEIATRNTDPLQTPKNPRNQNAVVHPGKDRRKAIALCRVDPMGHL